MHRSITAIAAVVFVLAAASGAAAQEWQSSDVRSEAMGGATVAQTTNITSSYANPAVLATDAEAPFEFYEAAFGLTGYGFTDVALEGDVIGKVDTIVDLYNELGGGTGFKTVQDDFNAGTHTAQDLQDAMDLIYAVGNIDEEGLGVMGHLGGGFDMRLGSFGFFYRDVVYAGLDPFLDFTQLVSLTDELWANFMAPLAPGVPATAAGINLAARLVTEAGIPIADAQTIAFNAEQALGGEVVDPNFQNNVVSVIGSTFNNAGTSDTETFYYNASGVVISGLRMREIGVSFALPLTLIAFPAVPSLNVGITLKEVIGETFREVITLATLEDGDDTADEILDNIRKNTKQSNKFNIDLGVSVNPIPYFTVGLSVRNILPMDFDVEGVSEDFEMDPQVRLGAEFSPLELVRVAADMDVLENEFDGLEGFESRMLAGGVELMLLPVRLRVGAFDNIASDESSIVYTGGIGIGFAGLSLDLGGQLSLKKVDIESESMGGSGSDKMFERMSFSAMLGYDVRF
ncbi:MAG: conjugal transfer protein TraF [Planctomycetota bacterium]|jgi:hypothetical protein